MDLTWVAPVWQVIMCGAVGLGCGVLGFFLLLSAKRASEPTVPQQMEQSRADLMRCIHGLLRSQIEAAEWSREMQVLQAKLPPGYRLVSEQALLYAQSVEVAMFRTAEQNGLFVRPFFTAGHAPTESVPLQPEPSKQPMMVAGQLVP